MKITVETRTGNHTFECAAGDTILYAGLAAGLTLPYECATGTCGTCRGRLASGSADPGWPEGPGYARLKREKGDVLMCQARPSSDCVLKVPANVATRPERHPIPFHTQAIFVRQRRLTHDVIDFRLMLDAPMCFEAGQFVAIGVTGITGLRAYSMVNHVGQTRELHLVVKQKPSGAFSDWLFAKVREGERLDVFGPLGQATFHPEEGRDVLCIAGGSGIAGMMAICERGVRDGYFQAHKGHVFFGVRTLADGFYVEELARLVGQSGGGLAATLALSHEQAPTDRHPQFPAVKLASGFVHEVALSAAGGEATSAIAYIAGPPPMVDGSIKLLTAAGLSRNFIRFDKFA